jgi:hypothetical protein
MGTVSPHLDYQLGSWAYTPLQAVLGEKEDGE